MSACLSFLGAQIVITAKWLACVYRSLDEFHDNQGVYEKLKAMKIIPLASNERVAVANNTVFFPLSDGSKLSAKGTDRDLWYTCIVVYSSMLSVCNYCKSYFDLFCPWIQWSGAYCICPVCLFVCLSVCLFVCLLSTLTFAIIFEMKR